MIEKISDIPLTFIPIFVAIDPFGILPIFTAITKDMTQQEKRAVIRYSILTSGGVGIVFALIGEKIFRILGITVDDFKIAGGIMLLVLAIIELVGRRDEHRHPHDVGVVPLGVPLIVGPAVLTTLIILIDHYGLMPTVLSLLLNLVIVFIMFSAEGFITRLIGKNGLLAISKIVALLLAAIAIMMIRLGIESYLGG